MVNKFFYSWNIFELIKVNIAFTYKNNAIEIVIIYENYSPAVYFLWCWSVKLWFLIWYIVIIASLYLKKLHFQCNVSVSMSSDQPLKLIFFLWFWVYYLFNPYGLLFPFIEINIFFRVTIKRIMKIYFTLIVRHWAEPYPQRENVQIFIFWLY